VLSLEEHASTPVVELDGRLARRRIGLDEVFALVAGRFAQAESRRRARLYLLGLLSGAERKNSRTLAKQAGTPAQTGCSGC